MNDSYIFPELSIENYGSVRHDMVVAPSLYLAHVDG